MGVRIDVSTVNQTTTLNEASGLDVKLSVSDRATARFTTKPSATIHGLRAEVTIYAPDETTPLFGGIIFQRQTKGFARHTYVDYDCVGYEYYLDHLTIDAGTLSGNQTLKSIMLWLNTTWFAAYGFSVDAAQVNGPTLATDGYSWERMGAFAALKLLGEAAGGYVPQFDPNKTWRMIKPSLASSTAPFSIADGNSNARELGWQETTEKYATKVIQPYGGSGTREKVETVTINAGHISAGYYQTELRSPTGTGMSITINGGAAFSPAASGTTLLWNWTTTRNRITPGTYTPVLGDVLVITYTAQYPGEAIADAGITPAIEYVAPAADDISDYTVALQQATGVLAAAYQSPRTFEIDSVVDGLRPGQVIAIASTYRSVSATNAMITNVSITMRKAVWSYRASAIAGVFKGSKLDFWRNLQSGGSGGSSVVTSTYTPGGTATLAGFPLTHANDTNVIATLGGSHATALVNPASITLGWSGQLAVARGGTGLASVTANRVPYGNGTSALQTSASLTFDGTTLATTAITASSTITAGSHLSVPATSKVLLNGQGGDTYLTEAGGNALDAFVDSFQLMRLSSSTGLTVFNTSAGTNFALTNAGNATLSGSIGHPSYASQTTKWRIDGDGGADFRYLFVDEMHAKSFIADLEQALAGGQIIAKSVAMLATAFTVPALAGSASFVVRDLPSAIGMPAFVSGDTVIFRKFSRASGALTISEAVGTVSTYVDIGNGTQQWQFNRYSGADGGGMATSTVVDADALVIDYGVTGNGYYEVNAIDGTYGINSPYAQVVTWATSPIAANRTHRARFGNLRGITSTAEYGLFAGTSYSANKFLLASDVNFELRGIDLKLYDGATNTVRINPTVPSFAMGSTLPSAYGTGTGIWMGKDTAYKFRVGDPSGDRLYWDGSNLGVVSTNLTIDSSGIRLVPAGSTTFAAGNSYRWTVADGTLGMFGYDYSGNRGVGIGASRTGGSAADLGIHLRLNDTVSNGSASILVDVSGSSGTITMETAIGGTISLDSGAIEFYLGATLPITTAINDYALVVHNNHGTVPSGLLIDYAFAAPNGTGNLFLGCFDNAGGGTWRLQVRSNGGIANFTANDVNLSDARIKTLSGPAPSQRATFRQLEFVLGRYTDSTRNVDDVMLTAQQVQAVYPELVEDFDSEKHLLGVREQGIVMRALKVIQELDADVQALETRLAAVERRP